MKLCFASCAVAFLATGVRSILISEQKSAFAETCTNIRLQWGQLNAPWLVADCLTGNGDERITSTVFLQSKIKDNEGGYDHVELEWSWLGGKHNQNWLYCRECTIAGSNMTCACLGKNVPYLREPSTIDLGEHIFNYAGHLLSNLGGEPSAIPPASTYPPPSPSAVLELEWNMNIAVNSSCQVYTRGPGWQAGSIGPTPCAAFYDLPYLMVWSARDCYNIFVYGTTDCRAGSEILTIGDKRVCHKLEGYQGSGGFRVEPKWNWG